MNAVSQKSLYTHIITLIINNIASIMSGMVGFSNFVCKNNIFRILMCHLDFSGCMKSQSHSARY